MNGWFLNKEPEKKRGYSVFGMPTLQEQSKAVAVGQPLIRPTMRGGDHCFKHSALTTVMMTRLTPLPILQSATSPQTMALQTLSSVAPQKLAIKSGYHKPTQTPMVMAPLVFNGKPALIKTRGMMSALIGTLFASEMKIKVNTFSSSSTIKMAKAIQNPSLRALD